MSRQVVFDKVNIRLPRGWQGDPVHLARQVAEQFQHRAADLHGAKQINLSLQGHFAGAGKRVAEQVGAQLSSDSTWPGLRRQGR